MDSAQPVKLPGFTAAADYSAAGAGQYKFVEIVSGTKTVQVCNATTDRPVGVLLNRPKAGEAAEVLMVGICSVQADANNIAIGDPLNTSADGQARIAGTGTDAYAQALQASSAVGDIITAFVNCGFFRIP